jgi:hypothetical protein
VKSSIGEFEQFLKDRFGITREEYVNDSQWRGTGNTIGALLLRLGLLDLSQIDEILDIQENDKRLFGEIAVDLGFLTEDQVRAVIAIQCYHQFVEVAENMVIRGYFNLLDLQLAVLEFMQNVTADASTPHVESATN